MCLILPSHLSEAFDATVELLSAGLPEQHLVLSGGSVLQAIWNHRTSADLDFFLPEAALGEDKRLKYDRMRIAAKSVEGGGHWVEGFDADGVQGRVADVRFSVGVAHWMRLEFGRDTVGGGGGGGRGRRRQPLKRCSSAKYMAASASAGEVTGAYPFGTCMTWPCACERAPNFCMITFRNSCLSKCGFTRKGCTTCHPTGMSWMRTGSSTPHTTWTCMAFRRRWRSLWRSETHP